MNFFLHRFFSPFHDCKILLKMIWHFCLFHRLMSLKNNNRRHHHHHHHYFSLAMIIVRERENAFLLLLLKFNCTSIGHSECWRGQTQNHIDWTRMGWAQREKNTVYCLKIVSAKKTDSICEWREIHCPVFLFSRSSVKWKFVQKSLNCVRLCAFFILWWRCHFVVSSFLLNHCDYMIAKSIVKQCGMTQWSKCRWTERAEWGGGMLGGACEIYVRLRVAKKSFC